MDRGYCGGCGGDLQPVCRGCRFVNEESDKFCGGCGSALGPHGAARDLPAHGPRMSISFESPPMAETSEMSELFAPVAVTPDDSLPAANINQADLDRLFGAGA
jgi:hypothetical protein